MTFLDRGRVATVVIAPPPSADPRSTPLTPRGLSASFVANGANVEGRLSLGMLAALIIGMLAFYYWTRTAQGGG